VSFQDVVSFFESAFWSRRSLFFSLFFALFLIICVVVCVSFLSFFALSCVVRKKLSIETRARVVAKKRERYHSVTNLGRKRQKSVVPSERKATK